MSLRRGGAPGHGRCPAESSSQGRRGRDACCVLQHRGGKNPRDAKEPRPRAENLFFRHFVHDTQVASRASFAEAFLYVFALGVLQVLWYLFLMVPCLRWLCTIDVSWFPVVSFSCKQSRTFIWVFCFAKSHHSTSLKSNSFYMDAEEVKHINDACVPCKGFPT